MIRNVLIVDDDQEMLLALKEGLDRYQDTFKVLMAGDGLIAVEKLKKHGCSLVVADLKMPGMDGFALLAHIMEHYADIPVIIITAYSTPEMEQLAWQGGAVGYIAKPFMIEDLAKQILTAIRKESEGGTLHNVSSGMFLQLVEMEQKTCTIRLFDKTSNRNGVLFFRDGELLEARVEGFQGIKAAYEIFSWEDVTLAIQNVCHQKKNVIQSELQPILLEAMRLKDEAADKGKPPVEPSAAPQSMPENTTEPVPGPPREAVVPDFVEQIRNKLINRLGDRCGLEDIYQDSSWNESLSILALLGQAANGGGLKVAYIDMGKDNDFIVLPGKNATIATVNPRCPRDKIIEVLSE